MKIPIIPKKIFFGVLSLVFVSTSISQTPVKVRNSDCQLYTTSENRSYEWDGECLDGYLHGKGILRVYDLNDTLLGEYNGAMENGMREGFGTVKGLNGAMKGYFYKGTFSDNLESGKGKAKYSNGDSYSGIFENGKRNGSGTYTYSDGTEYTGDHKDNERHGSGTLKLKDGTTYAGNFWNDEPEGEIYIRYANGDTYSGAFFMYEPHGFGTYTKANGDWYEGDFDSGKPHGEGMFRTAKGLCFEGTFEEGEPYNGILTDKKGKEKGRYEDGELIEGKK